jgi:hypothetical protein
MYSDSAISTPVIASLLQPCQSFFQRKPKIKYCIFRQNRFGSLPLSGRSTVPGHISQDHAEYSWMRSLYVLSSGLLSAMSVSALHAFGDFGHFAHNRSQMIRIAERTHGDGIDRLKSFDAATYELADRASYLSMLFAVIAFLH